ncbi:MAG: hypothetical protein IPL99_12245 [Candidatus Competibacteraceae bacterium]|nr:hypothetical protein [Candidatus Competibacteraceae bacterium]
MALNAGRLAARMMGVENDVVLYTVPAVKHASFTVSYCNQGTAVAKVCLALSTTATPQPCDWIEYETALNGKAVLERTGLALSAGQKIFVCSTKATVSVVIYGIEEDIS